QADKNLWTSRIFAGNWEALKSQVFADIFAQRKGTYQYRFYHKDGSLRWISQTNTSRWDETLNCWIVTAVSLDISNQKQAEEQLYKTEQWLNQFSHSSPSVIYTLVQEPDGFLWYEYISSASETINEVTAEQALKDASAVIGLMHPEEIPGYIAAVTHSAETLELFCHQWRIITPSGKLKWLQATSQPERRSNGAIAWYGVVLDITEQKQTEQALQQALQHIDTHFDKSPLAILEWDKDFRILRWSKQAERIFGWTAEEVKNLSWQPLAGRGAGETRRQAVEVETEQISASCSSESPICCKFVHEEDLERVNAEMCPLMNGLASRKAVQNRNYTKDGRVIVCQWYSSAVFDDTGNLVSVLSFAQDITDRKRAELELKQQKELRETIFNESTDAIFLVDAQTLLITDCNRRAVELFEVESKAELIGIEGRTLQRRPFTEAEINEISQTVQQKGFWSTELEYISHKGNLFWGNLAAKPVQIANKTIRLVRVTDISDRKKIEAALLESEQTNRALLQSLPDLLIRMSRDGTYLDVRTTEGVKLINPEKMKQGANIFEVLPSEIAQERSNYMQIALATGEVQIQEYQFEIEGTI
ncbi:MAG TPA: PAS domain S-box protein, partial [Phormidium sp.]